MANNTNDLTANLKVTLDKSSVTNIQKELSKQNFTVKTKIDVDKKDSLQSLKDAMKSLSSQMPTSQLMEGFITSLRQSVTELKELDTYLTKISKANSALSTSELAKIGSSLDTSATKSSLNGLLSIVNEIIKKVGALATAKIADGLFSEIKNFGRPKMSGLVLKFAEYHKCSLGY